MGSKFPFAVAIFCPPTIQILYRWLIDFLSNTSPDFVQTEIIHRIFTEVFYGLMPGRLSTKTFNREPGEIHENGGRQLWAAIG
jgi:hypothetical protein